MSAAIAGLRCPRCGSDTPAADGGRFRGCPRCRAEGVTVNLTCDYRPDGISELLGRDVGRGLWRFAAALPVPASAAVGLGEGDTPLVELGGLAERIGVGRLLAKNESANPTWSHKDRLVALTVTAARALGAQVITAASTGNHGASVAAYAARAGMRCVIATIASVPETMKALMQAYGADVVALPTSDARYELVIECVERFGWYPASNVVAPPVGSDPYGVEGYKTIAYELYEQCDGRLPDWVVVPVAYGDCLAGIGRGFDDLVGAGLAPRPPRLVGAELFGALEAALGGGPAGPVATRPTAAFSIGGAWATYQAVDALRRSDGVACNVTEDELLSSQLQLAGEDGLFFEAASAVPFAAAARLARAGVIGRGDTVVCIATSSGLKDPGSVRTRRPAVPTIEPTAEALRDALAAAGRLDQAAEEQLFPTSPTRERTR